MIAAAIDFGRKRIGIAVCDPTGLLARPLTTVETADAGQQIELTAKALTDAQVEHLLIGLPRHMDGSEGDSAQAAKAFGQRLATKTGLPIEWIDERLSTVQASRMLSEAGQDTRRQKKRIDMTAAVILLQSWLDTRSSHESWA